MPTSRRRFVAVAGAALVAGCSGADEEAERETTVTPVDVPRSAGDVLQAVESVPVPSIPDAPIVSAAHRSAVVSHVEERVAAAEAALDAADDVEIGDVDRLDADAAPFEACRSRLEGYREAPGRLQFRRVARTFGDVAAVLGYARAASGDLDVDGVRAAADAARTRYFDVSDGILYRVTSPVVEFLPTVAAAEAGLDRAGGHRFETGPLEADLEEATPADVADVWRDVEGLELETTNAAGYLDTALDASTPPRADAISDALGGHLEVLSELDVPRRVDGRPLPSRVRTVLSSVRSHRSEVLAAADPTDPVTARPVEHLLDTIRIRSQLEAYNVAGEATFTRIDDTGFPTELVMPEKEAAVERVETLVGAPPLQRHLGGLADDMVTYGDRLQPGQGTNPVATAHFMYVAAQTYVDRALEHGEQLAATLEPTPGDNS